MDKRAFARVSLILLLLAGLAACATAPANLDVAKKAYDAGDYSTAFPQFKQLAANGDVQAEDYLAQMYMAGQGVPQDYVVAEHWVSLAADGGVADAEYEMGSIYASGLVGHQDYDKAVFWYRKAADQDYVAAYANLGALYAEGRGVPQDYAQALSWYMKGAEAGDPAAEVGVGAIYQVGQGVPEDYALAISWYTKAVEQMYPTAAENLGYMQFNGLGEEKNAALGVQWYEVAANDGSFKAELFIANVYSHALYGETADPVKVEKMYQLAADHMIITVDQLSNELRAIIDAHKTYPAEAVRAHIEGKATISFDLPDVVPLNIRVDSTSGSPVLDEAAVEAVKDSVFPHRSAALNKTKHFVVSINFTGTSPATLPSHQ